MFDPDKDKGRLPSAASTDPRQTSGNEKETAAGAGAPTLALPKGGGAIRGIGEKFTVNPVTGTGFLAVPIATSPARAGFGPSLTLHYDSGSGNGPFGLGWSLSLPAITRKTNKGIPQYSDTDESDTFLLSDAEDLVPLLLPAGSSWQRQESVQAIGGDNYQVRRYRPRIEGLFARIERWTRISDGDTHWRTLSKDNVTTLYGATANSRIADPDNPNHVFQWRISQSMDDAGNAILYEYKPENSQQIDLGQACERNRSDHSRAAECYLKRIQYGNPTPAAFGDDLSQRADWLLEVVFDFGEHYTEGAAGKPITAILADNQRPWAVRQDPFSAYRSGFEARTYRLCQRVLMFHHFAAELGDADTLVSATHFGYAPNAVATALTSVIQSGYTRVAEGSYAQSATPAVEFQYSLPVIQQTVRELDTLSAENLPIGIDGARYQWVDLDGEGLSGVLTEQGSAWHYKRNLSANHVVMENGASVTVAQFGADETVCAKPSLSRIGEGRQRFMDISGDGRLDLVQWGLPVSGYYERTEERSWNPFTAFENAPNLAWDDPNLKMLDLTGNGFQDILITGGESLTWHESLAVAGFTAPDRIALPDDNESGPRVLFADATRSVFLADFSGDGLMDIVRIASGEVCYWPNRGYGRFGAKVTMDAAPVFDAPDVFDPRRIRLADIDGSGTTDIIYLHSGGVRLYFNQSGNSWSSAAVIDWFPRVDELATIQALDLLGNGTACLTWSSGLPGDAGRALRYIDLMGGQKPWLLIGSKNQLGAETVVQYAPSTKFYLQDSLAGTPWVTRLPFPVHVVETVTTMDRISRSRFTTRSSYHHGYFDGIEREFRGFGRIDQTDTQEFAALLADPQFPQAANVDAASYVPPALTKTWYHTGAYFDAIRVSSQYAHEYYHESSPGDGASPLTDAQVAAMTLPDSALPLSLLLADGTQTAWSFSADEIREACRALKGSLLRQEVYALDENSAALRPYSVSESNYTVEAFQPRGGNNYCVFHCRARESVQFQYERALYAVAGGSYADPRVSHAFTLATDGFGNVLQSAAVGYGRRYAETDPLFHPDDVARQQKLLLTYTETSYTNAIDAADRCRLPLSAETAIFEIGNATPAASQASVTNLFRFDEIAALMQIVGDGHHEIPSEDVLAATAAAGQPYRRLVKKTRRLYRKDDLSALLPLGLSESRALPGEAYALAYTPGLLDKIYVASGKIAAAGLSALGAGWIDSKDQKAAGLFPAADPDGQWWAPTGRTFYSPIPGDTAAQELAFASAHFFLPHRYVAPLGNTSVVAYDPHYTLFLVQATDALGNQTSADYDFRVLKPQLLTDANGNRGAVAFDMLGHVAGTAVMGKTTEALGDSLAGFAADLAQTDIDAFFAAPTDALATALLGTATSRVVYDMGRYARLNDPTKPVYAATITRETHANDPAPAGGAQYQVQLEYSDGFGRAIQRKLLAEPDPTASGPPPLPTRWVGTGWTILDNKGNPVRQYEPFFTASSDFEFATVVGVSPILFYDPLGRGVATLHPNHTYEKIVFTPWRQEAWDVNDTVLQGDPRTDADVGAYFRRLDTADYLPSWHDARTGGALGAAEQTAAAATEAHQKTPGVTYPDSLGRPFLAVADNAANGKYVTRTLMDIEGRPLSVTDALGRAALVSDYDLLGKAIHTVSMDSGERWSLDNAVHKPLVAWDARGYRLRYAYDALVRPTQLFVQNGAAAEIVAEQTVYGEAQPNPAAQNLRGKLFQQRDGAGLVTHSQYDFKGNLIKAQRQLLQDYKAQVDWSAAPALQAETFTSATAYDALNRPVTLTMPDATVIHPAYNRANLLEQVTVNLQGAAAATAFVSDLEYDAKGQRQSIAYGNGVTTQYTYEPATFRLTELKTTRASDRALLQDLIYTYDPVGNVTQIADGAQQTIYFKNAQVQPVMGYVYDAVYRLIQGGGREHLGQMAGTQPQYDSSDSPRLNLPHPNDGKAMQAYVEQYAYDDVGSILSVVHQAAGGNWTRGYACDPNSNRLLSTSLPGDPAAGPYTAKYTYDANGNMLSMPHLAQMAWDYRNALRMVDLGGGGKCYYVYDSAGQRVRKVWEKSANRIEERLYLGGYERFQQRDGTGAVALERETVHVMDDIKRIALVDTLTQGNDGTPRQLIRYQYGNHLGSASLELDDQAAVISYEEYHPYGSTSYQAVRTDIQVPLKRYRYTGKERDDESGLYYHGARYYAPWLGRWTSPDPAGMVDGSNLYVYVKGNPVRLTDPSGQQGGPPGQMWFYEARAYQQFVTATARGRGFTRRVMQNAQKVYEMWGGHGKADLAHVEKPFALTKAGETTAVSPQEPGINRSYSAAEKRMVQDARANNQFTRIDGADPTAQKGTRYGQPKQSEVFESDSIKEWQTPAPSAQPGASPSSPSAESAASEQMELPFGKTAEPAQAASGAKEATIASEAATGAKEATAGVEAAGEAAKAASTGARALKAAAPVLKTIAKGAQVAGKVAGIVGIATSAYELATAKTADARVDAGIGLASNALMASGNPLAEALGGGMAAGQFLEKKLNVSEVSSGWGVSAYEGLKKIGVGDTASFVAGGVVTVAATPVALGVAAVAKTSEVASRAWHYVWH